MVTHSTSANTIAGEDDDYYDDAVSIRYDVSLLPLTDHVKIQAAVERATTSTPGDAEDAGPAREKKKKRYTTPRSVAAAVPIAVSHPISQPARSTPPPPPPQQDKGKRGKPKRSSSYEDDSSSKKQQHHLLPVASIDR
jgi:hypothetical protein